MDPTQPAYATARHRAKRKRSDYNFSTFTAGTRAPAGTRLDYTCDRTVGEIAAKRADCTVNFRDKLTKDGHIAKDDTLFMESRDVGTKGGVART